MIINCFPTNIEEFSHSDIIFNQFINAATNGDERNVLSLLLTSKININGKYQDGTAALLNAVFSNKESMVSLLLDKGADINFKSGYGSTALIYAARYSTDSMISLLLDKGAETNIKDHDGYTALMVAARFSKDSMVPFFLIEERILIFRIFMGTLL